jgi:hypothetical protein
LDAENADLKKKRLAATTKKQNACLENMLVGMHHLLGTKAVPGVYSRPSTPHPLISDEVLKTNSSIKEYCHNSIKRSRSTGKSRPNSAATSSFVTLVSSEKYAQGPFLVTLLSTSQKFNYNKNSNSNQL